MRKNRYNKKVKQHAAEHKDNSGNSRSFSSYGFHNFANINAGKLRQDKIARLSGAWKAFIIFSSLVILDYFLTVYAIRQHFNEFNPLTVFIFKNFQSPELVFLLFKIFVIGLNWLLIYSIFKLEKTVKIFGKIVLAYVLLAMVFAFAVVVYDIGIITGAFALPQELNAFISGFFKFFGLV